MTRRITIVAKSREKITVDLVGTEYLVTPPKAMLGLAIAETGKNAGEDPHAMVEAMKDWVLAAFGRKEGPKVIARLSAPDDELDLAELMELMQELTKAATPDPTM
ncbi:MAG TPA: hypothetical protein VIU87_08720 [Mycobacterium sp.]